MRIAALDLGTNSFHLIVVDAHPDGAIVPLVREKEMLRLGDRVTRDGRIGDEASDRAVATVRRFRALAEAEGADELVACATSAIREADDGGELVDRLRAEAGVEVRVISGRAEARLVFAAVRASVVIDTPPALCFDLGGGSLEVMVGDAGGLLWSTSVKLGVARLSAELVRNDPPTRGDLRRLRVRITEVLQPVAEAVRDLQPLMAVGTSGTLCDLARMIAASRAGAAPASVNQFSFDRDEFLALHERLVACRADERRQLPGLDGGRSDLVPAGSVLLETAMELFDFHRLTVSEWALREGIVLEALQRCDLADWTGDARSIRRASIFALGRRCSWDEAHSRQVAALATHLFDQTLTVHRLHAEDRELLEDAALLHDIGEHIGADAHHKHTAYLIQHGRLRGFARDEVAVLASLARYHRRGEPKPAHEPYGSLSPADQRRVIALAALLRVADGLDRGHSQVVDGIDVEVRPSIVRIRVLAYGDCELELWGARRKRGLFEQLYGRRVELVAVPAG